MWPRKQIDISWSDLGYALLQVARIPRSDPTCSVAGWLPADESLVALSVRTGWDLLLASLQLPRGSEILISAVTIPDMVRIAEQHGLVPVPIDIEPERLELAHDQLERAISPRCRAVLVAHLFGARADMAHVHRLAKQHNLLVFEDCAQAFVGRGYAGHEATDCTMFSFGPIKTATALGGAALRVRDRLLRAKMLELQQSYPTQNHWSYFKRLAWFGLLRLLGQPAIYGAFVRLCRLAGVDYDRELSNAAHSFSNEDVLKQLRQRPCSALVRTLGRRLATFDDRNAAKLRRRARRGQQLAETLPAGVVLGGQNSSHAYWAMAVTVANPQEVVDALCAAGFDATMRSSLVVVRAPDESMNDARPHTSWLRSTVFLPDASGMPECEWQRIICVLAKVAAAPPAETPEPSASVPVSNTS